MTEETYKLQKQSTAPRRKWRTAVRYDTVRPVRAYQSYHPYYAFLVPLSPFPSAQLSPRRQASDSDIDRLPNPTHPTSDDYVSQAMEDSKLDDNCTLS